MAYSQEKNISAEFVEKSRAKRPTIFDSSITNTRIVKKGLFNTLRYNDRMIEYDHRFFQWPFSLTLKWKGFWGHETLLFGFDSNLTFYLNSGKILGKKTLYLSYADYYDTLPTCEEDLANDDADDLTFPRLNDGITSDADDTADDKHLDKDLYMKTETMQLRLSTEILMDIISRAKNSEAQEPKIVKVGGSLFNRRLLVYSNDWAFHIMPHFFSDSEIDSTPIYHMAFFLNKKSFGKSDIYCGYHRQIDVVSVPKEEALKFQDWCKERAPRLSETGIDLRSSIWGNPLNIWRYLHPDKISLTSNALVYTRKTLRRDEMIYLPFSKIKMFLTGSGIFTKRFEIYGEQNIVPKYSFSRSAVSKIKKILEDHGIKIKNGTSYHSTFLFPRNWFGKAPLLITSGDTAIFYPKRIESKMREFNGHETRMASMTLKEIEHVTWYKPLFSLFGTIVIEGTSESIRTDQHGKSITLIIPDLSMFCYSFFFLFSGSLKKFLKGANDISFERKLKNYKLN